MEKLQKIALTFITYIPCPQIPHIYSTKLRNPIMFSSHQKPIFPVFHLFMNQFLYCKLCFLFCKEKLGKIVKFVFTIPNTHPCTIPSRFLDTLTWKYIQVHSSVKSEHSYPSVFHSQLFDFRCLNLSRSKIVSASVTRFL